MYNLLIAGGSGSWDEGVYEFPRERVAVEYTDSSISERYRDLKIATLQELMKIPTVFAVEGEEEESRVGKITTILAQNGKVRIVFKFDENIPPLPKGFIADNAIHFELGRLELHRTHWAIKGDDLFAILRKKGIISETPAAPANRPVETINADPGFKVFIVHGHDETAMYEMSASIREIGAIPIILHEQANSGLTIIEKIERYTDVRFGVVLYTPCDLGGKSGHELNLRSRARQNVVFEHGYLMAKLGRGRVMACVKGVVETPSDISGIVYTELDGQGLWKRRLLHEMQAAGFTAAASPTR